MRYLTYPGDVRHIVGEVKGPDMHGAYYRAIAAEHDPDTGKTRVGFRPLRMAELEALAGGQPLDPVEAATR